MLGDPVIARCGNSLVWCGAVLLLTSCARHAPGPVAGSGRGGRIPLATASRASTQAGASDHPYLLSLGQSVYRVECEADPSRLRIALAGWLEDGRGMGAVFRVTNPGDRAVLVWNVRQQISVESCGRPIWETREQGYPAWGATRSDIPAGGSVEFPVFSPGEGSWRVCLLYSRELSESVSPSRRFDGTFEVVGPGVREERQGEISHVDPRELLSRQRVVPAGETGRVCYE